LFFAVVCLVACLVSADFSGAFVSVFRFLVSFSSVKTSRYAGTARNRKET
jgi:hypothetical protein